MAFNKSKALEEAARLVSQRKLPEAIKRYLAITEKDPEDLSLLNTTGDLCVRAGNIPEALRQFNKLATSYTREGFILKAIAIYKKIVKLDTQSVEAFLKLAELYASQGLSHEAREQYAQALAFCQAHRLQEKTLQILTKLVAQEPSNAAYRMRLAEFHEAAGRRSEALEEYLEVAALAGRQKNTSLGATAIAKARKIEPRHLKVLLFEASRAADGGRFDEAQRIYLSAPEMKTNHEARLIFLTALLATGKLNEALNVAVETYRDRATDFEPLNRFVKQCLDAGNPEAALEPLKKVADLALEQDGEKLVNSLRQIAAKGPSYTANLEWMEALCMRATHASGWAETLEALAKRYGEAGEWEKAGRVYSRLLETDEQNTRWRSLLNRALERQGKMKPVAPEQARPVSEAEPQRGPETMPDIESASSSDVLSAPVATNPAVEIDFLNEWQGFTATQDAPSSPSAPPATNLDEEKSEVQFYLDHGLLAEARSTLEALEKKYPAHPELIGLRKRVEGAGMPVESEAEPAPDFPATSTEGLDSFAESFSQVSHASSEDLLAEMESDSDRDRSQDDPAAHYHLGMAFREMGLLDEAIGEFQKVVKRADKESFSPYFLEACSLLGSCFMEKGEHRIAVKWYLRALEAPNTDEETRMALTYDLAGAYEQSGDSQAALEKFSEVYSLNIDYREVAEKIRTLREHPPDR